MSFAPATRYSDRDVRENTEFFDIAARYLQSYRGDFEYLLDVQRHYTVHGSLSVAMTRGVLNCMRNDPRVAGDLPAPKSFPQDVAEDADVVSITRSRKRRRYGHNNPRQCPDTESHSSHSWGSDEYDYEWCEGVPYEINRETYLTVPATVKRPYAVAKYAMKMVHKVAGEGSTFTWTPKPHEWGWFWDDQPELNVKLVCRYPSLLKEPKLLTQAQADDLVESGLEFCRHCFPEGDNAS